MYSTKAASRSRVNSAGVYGKYRDGARDCGEEQHELSVQRTLMSFERTLMAWIRTSLSMISFGFTIFKFFQYLRSSGIGQTRHLYEPRVLGLAFTGLGTFLLMLATIEYAVFLRRNRKLYGRGRFSIALFAAVMISVIGSAAFASILMNL